MQSDELQRIVDDLATQLGRSVAIDDPAIRLLAASRHFGDEDQIRVKSVLNRSVSPELARTVLAQGIAEWTGPGRLVLDPETDLNPRLCVPIRCHGMSLGFLWLIDAQNTLTKTEITAAADTADSAGQILYRRLLLRERSRTRNEAIMRELVGPDTAMRAQAVSELTTEQILVNSPRVVMIAAQVVDPERGGADARHDLALEMAVEESVRSTPPRATLTMVHGHRARILVALPRAASENLVDHLVDRLTTRFRQQSGHACRLVIGIGASTSGLEHAVDSHRQAMTAVKAAQLLPSLGDTLRWDQLGPYELLLRLSEEDVLSATPVPALDTLATHDPHGTLLETLEAFLDNAGDVRRTAEHLCVHRATLYHRLNRIQQVTGTDLNDGINRLTLHLALKLARLAGGYRSHATNVDDRGHIV